MISELHKARTWSSTNSFTLSEDGTRLAWEARIADPVNFTEPVVMEGEWVWVQGGEMIPYDCALPENTE